MISAPVRGVLVSGWLSCSLISGFLLMVLTSVCAVLSRSLSRPDMSHVFGAGLWHLYVLVRWKLFVLDNLMPVWYTPIQTNGMRECVFRRIGTCSEGFVVT